jgi:hypothetical protein
LILVLQQALLYDGAVVLFFVCKKEESFLLMRRNNTVYAWSRVHNLGVAAGGSLFRRHDVLVLYDPPESRHSGARFAAPDCQMIVAMSANQAHTFGATRKEKDGGFRYLAPPSFDELGVMLPLIAPQKTPESFWACIREVGPLSRYIVDEEKYGKRMLDREEAIASIGNVRKLQDVLDSGGWVRQQNTLPGTLLSIAGSRLESIGSQVLPKNYVDYEGQHISYKKRVVMILSDTA